MTSIGTIVSDLETIKANLAEAKGAADETTGHTEEVATLAKGMDLDDTGKELNSLGTEIQKMAERFIELSEDIDKLINRAEALRHGPVGTGKAGAGKAKFRTLKSWKSNKSWKSKGRKRYNQNSQSEQREVMKAPNWQQRLSSKYSTEMTTIVTGGVTQGVGQMAHLPPGVQVIFTTFMTTLAIRKARQEEAEKNNPNRLDGTGK